MGHKNCPFYIFRLGSIPVTLVKPRRAYYQLNFFPKAT